MKEQDKSSDIEQQPPFSDRKISNIQPPKIPFQCVHYFSSNNRCTRFSGTTLVNQGHDMINACDMKRYVLTGFFQIIFRGYYVSALQKLTGYQRILCQE